MCQLEQNISPLLARDTPADEVLVQRIIDGSVWAEEVLYRRYVDRIMAFCLRTLRHQADAEDVVQDTFVIAFGKLGGLKEPAKFQQWAMQIAVSRMHRIFRRQKLQRAFFRISQTNDRPLTAQMKHHAPQEHRMELALLDAALDRMTHDERLCWVLRFLEEYTVREITEISGLSSMTVKRRLSDAALTVQTHLGEKIHD